MDDMTSTVKVSMLQSMPLCVRNRIGDEGKARRHSGHERRRILVTAPRIRCYKMSTGCARRRNTLLKCRMQRKRRRRLRMDGRTRSHVVVKMEETAGRAACVHISHRSCSTSTASAAVLPPLMAYYLTTN